MRTEHSPPLTDHAEPQNRAHIKEAGHNVDQGSQPVQRTTVGHLAAPLSARAVKPSHRKPSVSADEIRCTMSCWRGSGSGRPTLRRHAVRRMDRGREAAFPLSRFAGALRWAIVAAVANTMFT